MSEGIILTGTDTKAPVDTGASVPGQPNSASGEPTRPPPRPSVENNGPKWRVKATTAPGTPPDTATTEDQGRQPQHQPQQKHRRTDPPMKRLFNTLCCIPSSERDDQPDSLKGSEPTALDDLGSQATRRYQQAQAPAYKQGSTKNTKSNNNNNNNNNKTGGKDPRILDKPVPSTPDANDRTEGNESQNGSQHSGDEEDESIVRKAATSVQSPINDAAELIEKTPDVDEDEYLAATTGEPPAWLLGPIPKELKGRKCLVLDLDETLVHSSFKFIPQADFVIPVEIENQFHNVYVIKRPGVDEFMERVGKMYEIVVFTASVSKYGDPLLDQLDIHNVIHHRLFRESCYNHQGNYIKNLSQLGRPLNEVIIIDNSPASYVFHPQHAVPVSSWFSDAHDNELLDMVPFLEDLSNESVSDVTMVLDVNIV